MAKHQVSFFATTADLELLLRSVEATRQLHFVATGLFDSPELEALQSLLTISGLGGLDVGDINQAEGYLIAPRDHPIVARSVPQRRGGVRYAVDQVSNPATIVIRPGGSFSDQCLIASQVGTLSDDPVSLDLYRAFSSVIRRHFSKIGSYFVGPQAADLLDQGWRLTSNVKSPPIYDLSRD